MRDGEEYCLYHKPNKNENEAVKFYEKLKEQATIEIDGQGEEKLVYNNDVCWAGYVFPKHLVGEAVRFCRANFKGEADFFGATFEGVAGFHHVTFKSEADFHCATFKREANFLEATFEGEADFSEATFKGVAVFLEATFKGEANFLEATFEGEADFSEATFKDKCNFSRATFKGEADFSGATFKGVAIFERITFMDVASFMGGSCMGGTSFLETCFERTCFFDMREFFGILILEHAVFRQGVSMGEERCQDKMYHLPQAEEEACRVQKIAYEKRGLKEDAEKMFLREMRARRRGLESHYEEEKEKGITVCRKKPLWDREKPILRRFRWDNLRSHLSSKTEHLLVDLTSQYGTSWQRIILTALALIFLFAGVYCIGAHLSITSPHLGGIYSTQPTATEVIFDLKADNEAIAVEVKAQDRVLVKNFIDLLYFSASTFTPVRHGDMYPTGLMKHVASIQSLIGAFYVALFVVVFARKWMR